MTVQLPNTILYISRWNVCLNTFRRGAVCLDLRAKHTDRQHLGLAALLPARLRFQIWSLLALLAVRFFMSNVWIIHI